MLYAKNLSLSFGPKVILNRFSATLLSGERIALVGQNGAGKSSLLKILAKELVPDAGSVEQNPNLRVAYLPQDPKLPADITVAAAVRLGMQDLYSFIQKHHDLCEAIATAKDSEQKNLQHQISALSNEIDALGGFSIEHRVEEVLNRLHISNKDQLVKNLSGGEKRRVDLARVMLSAPELYLLDEPTNHLDMDSIRFLVDTFCSSPTPILFISHDRAFIDSVATKIMEIENGAGYTHDTPYANYLENRIIRMDISSRTLHRKERLMVRELAWLRAGTPARTTKQNARISRADSLIDEVQKNTEIQRQKRLDIRSARGGRLGKTILELQDVGFIRNDRVLFKNLNLILTAGDRYGIVGANGSGKTTLLSLMSLLQKPTEGKIVQGVNTKVIQFDQNRKQLDPELSLKETLVEQGDYVFLGDEKIHIASYLERFLFSPTEMNRKVETLSGGEQNRLLLAKLLKEPSNCLLLDEPTNDLDSNTLGILEEILEDYDGVVFIVSHDRKFLDQVCNGIIAFEPNENGSIPESNVVIYQGDYTTYERLKKEASKKNQAERNVVVVKETIPVRAKVKRSYKEQREYENIESEIHQAETEKSNLEQIIAQGDIFREDAKKAIEIGKKIAELETQIAKLYERWQHLEDI